MSILLRKILGAAAVAAIAGGCDTARPGAGFTNGPSPAVLKAEEKPAIRDDLQEPADTAEKPVADRPTSTTGGNPRGTQP